MTMQLFNGADLIYTDAIIVGGAAQSIGWVARTLADIVWNFDLDTLTLNDFDNDLQAGSGADPEVRSDSGTRQGLSGGRRDVVAQNQRCGSPGRRSGRLRANPGPRLPGPAAGRTGWAGRSGHQAPPRRLKQVGLSPFPVARGGRADQALSPLCNSPPPTGRLARPTRFRGDVCGRLRPGGCSSSAGQPPPVGRSRPLPSPADGPGSAPGPWRGPDGH